MKNEDPAPLVVDDARSRGAKRCMEVLKSRKFTDCVFLVGPKDGEQQEFPVVKAMMMMMSPFMEGLFNSPLCPPSPIRIDYMDPKVFMLITEYIHTGHLLTPMECEEIADVAVAADFFLIKPLTELCVELIKEKARVDNVWNVLNKVIKVDPTSTAMADGVKNVLCKLTTECLNHPSFLLAEFHSIQYLLKQEDLAVQSEFQLVECCLLWAEGQPDKRKAMGTLLPSLRLLTLTSDQLSRLLKAGLCIGEDSGMVLRYSLTKQLPQTPFASTICPDLKPRNFVYMDHNIEMKERYLTLVPDSFHSQNFHQLKSNEMQCTSALGSVRNRLTIKFDDGIFLTEIHFINKIKPPVITYDKDLETYSELEQPYSAACTIEWIQPKLEEMAFDGNFTAVYNGTSSLRFHQSVFIPKGTRLDMKIKMKCKEAASIFRKIAADRVNATFETDFQISNRIASAKFYKNVAAIYSRKNANYRHVPPTLLTPEVLYEPIYIKGLSYIVKN